MGGATAFPLEVSSWYADFSLTQRMDSAVTTSLCKETFDAQVPTRDIGIRETDAGSLRSKSQGTHRGFLPSKSRQGLHP